MSFLMMCLLDLLHHKFSSLYKCSCYSHWDITVLIINLCSYNIMFASNDAFAWLLLIISSKKDFYLYVWHCMFCAPHHKKGYAFQFNEMFVCDGKTRLMMKNGSFWQTETNVLCLEASFIFSRLIVYICDNQLSLM